MANALPLLVLAGGAALLLKKKKKKTKKAGGETLPKPPVGDNCASWGPVYHEGKISGWYAEDASKVGGCKLVCESGFKLSADGKSCIPVSGAPEPMPPGPVPSPEPTPPGPVPPGPVPTPPQPKPERGEALNLKPGTYSNVGSYSRYGLLAPYRTPATTVSVRRKSGMVWYPAKQDEARFAGWNPKNSEEALVDIDAKGEYSIIALDGGPNGVFIAEWILKATQD